MKLLWKYKSGIASSDKWNDNLWFGEWIDNWTSEWHRRKASALEGVVGDKCGVALAILQIISQRMTIYDLKLFF